MLIVFCFVFFPLLGVKYGSGGKAQGWDCYRCGREQVGRGE